MKKECFYVRGITCGHCKSTIEDVLQKQEGVIKAKVSIKEKTLTLYYDDSTLTVKQLNTYLNPYGYALKGEADEKPKKEGWYVLGIGMFVVFAITQNIPDISMVLITDENISLILLFVIGLTTSVHCVTMCGGLMLLQVIGNENQLQRNISYNMGRLISYTILGGVVGGIGSAITKDLGLFKYVPVVLGVVMLLVGLEKLNILSFKKMKTHLLVNRSLGKVKLNVGREKGPFVMGLLNGFMPCGPLQLMQLYALGTKSVFDGALSMFVFSLGTMPLMFGVGMFIQKATVESRQLIYKIGGVLIVVLGINMTMNGLTTLSGGSVGFEVVENEVDGSMVEGYQVIELELENRSYGNITVKKGIPVKIKIHATPKSLNGCNRSMMIKAFGVTQELDYGTNDVIFTPNKTGVFTLTCWMGMIKNKLIVIE